MIEKREFLTELYRRRISGHNEIPFIEYFQKDKSLRNALYCSYLNHIQRDSVIKHISQVASLKILKNISDTIRDFDKLVLTKSEYSSKDYAEVFAKDITTKLEKIALPRLTRRILTDFVEKMESVEIGALRIVWQNEYEFAKKFGVSVGEAKRKYRELKRYADNHFNEYLNTIMGNTQDYKATNTLDYYTDENVIPNQDLVNDTIEYFKNGKGSRVFKPLEALNLIWKQHEYVVENWGNPNTVLNHLRSIPISEIEKHVLLGFILKWFGGYPIIEHHESNPSVGATKKAIEKEFLSYKADTPEKEYCKADLKERKDFMKLGIAMTASMNNNLPITDVLDGMGGLDWSKSEKKYYKFDTLFKDAADSGELGKFQDGNDFLIQRSKAEYDFKVWLQDEKNWEYGNDEQYQTFLSKDCFHEFFESQNYHLPRKGEVWQLEDLYQHYLTTNRFLLQVVLKPFDKDHYDEVCNNLEDYQYTYEYIYCKLDPTKRVELKHDTLDHLNKVKVAQTASKFRIVLDKKINHLNSFDGLNDSEIYKRSIGVAKIADEDTADRLRIKEGDRYYRPPDAKNKAELFERFEKLHCQSLCESYQRAFKKKYGTGNRKVIKDELREIEDSIDRANQLSTVDTFKQGNNSNEAEYSRLIYGYYQNKQVQNYSVHDFFPAKAIDIYAKYVLYKKWLESKLLEFNPSSDEVNPNEDFTPIQKAHIVLDIKGDNDWNTTSPVFHHIKDILAKHSLTSNEAKEIMLDMKGMNSPELNTNVIEPIINYLERIEFEPRMSNNNILSKADEIIKHPAHDPNLWNIDCYNLYKYLFDNHYSGTKRQLTNIWFYLKEYDPIGKKYILNATKDNYKAFIQNNYHVTIKNFDKAQTKYSEKDYPTLDGHRRNFEATLN